MVRRVWRRRAFVAAGLAAVLAAPGALANSVLDYSGFSNASVSLGDRTFRIYVHKSRNTFLLQPAWKDMGRQPTAWPDADWQTAAAALVRPVGCAVPQTVPLARWGATWEATYLCPLGIDLPALVKQQAAALRGGAALHP